MKEIRNYPKRYRKNILKVMYTLSTDAETAFNMIKFTALLLDLDMDDDGVFYAILMDVVDGTEVCA